MNRSQIQRENRRSNARALELLGFDAYEISNYLGVSSNTVKTYLRELEGAEYNDLFEFVSNEEILNLFNNNEQEFLKYILFAIKNSERLSRRARTTKKISEGKGISGWIHKKFIKDTEKFKEENKRVNKEMEEFFKEINKRIKEIKNKEKYPHLSKSKLNIEIKRIIK